MALGRAWRRDYGSRGAERQMWEVIGQRVVRKPETGGGMGVGVGGLKSKRGNEGGRINK